MFKIDSIDKLLDFYRSKGKITLVGLNDSQLINVTNPWAKGSFDLLADTFEKAGIPTVALNVGSSFYNKAEHAKSIVENDLTVKEIQLLNSFSYLEAYSKVLRDIGLPFGLPKFMERIIRTSFRDKDNADVRISELLEDNPVVITSFMANNVMRAVANNPWAITKDYKNRHKTPNFDYTLAKTKDRKVLEEIIELTKKSYDTILSKTNGQVYGIGFFMPNGMAKEEGLIVFEEYINQCNYAYSELCKSLGVHYVDVSALGSTTGNVDFHASPVCIKDATLTTMASHIGERRMMPYDVFSENRTFGINGVCKEASDRLDAASVEYFCNALDLVNQNTIYERQAEQVIAQNAKKAYTKYLNKHGKNQ